VLLVIFGAGASYDSVPHLPPPSNPADAIQHRADLARRDRPPLANQLFEDRREFVTAMASFPECMELIPTLRKRGVAVEQELARIREQSKTFQRVHRELAAIRYYLHVALWECQERWSRIHQGITNYAALLREVERWRFEHDQQVCFVSFNYDTMLEKAMRQVLDFEIKDLNSYVSRDPYRLVKLHGSVNWGLEIDGIADPISVTVQGLIKDAEKLQVSKRYRLVDHYVMLCEDSNRVVVTPAIAIPVDKKDEFACPETHIEALQRVLPHVQKIITIGWRATEDKFLNLLFSNLKPTAPPDLMIVSGDIGGATETLNNLTTEGRTHGLRFSRKAEPIIDGFSGLIHRLGHLEGFLRDTAATAFRA